MIEVKEFSIPVPERYVNKDMNGSGLYYSRFIASWAKVYGPWFDKRFEEWLKSFGISEDDIYNMKRMAQDGKFELEESIRHFMEENGIEKFDALWRERIAFYKKHPEKKKES